MKKVNYNEALSLLEEIGNQVIVTIPFEQREDDGEDIITEKVVLSDGMVYNPSNGKQVGTSSSKENAKEALNFVSDKFIVKSTYFSWANGDYVIE